MTRLAAFAGWCGTIFHHITRGRVNSLLNWLCNGWHAVQYPKWVIIRFVRGHHGQSFAEILFLIAEATLACRHLNLVTGLWTHAPPPAICLIPIIDAPTTPIIVLSVEMPRLQLSFSLAEQSIVKPDPLSAIFHSNSGRCSLIEWILNALVVMRREKLGHAASWFIYSFIERFPGSHFNPWTKACKLANFPAKRFDVLVHATPFFKI